MFWLSRERMGDGEKRKAVVLTLRSVGLLTLLDKIMLIGAAIVVFDGASFGTNCGGAPLGWTKLSSEGGNWRVEGLDIVHLGAINDEI